MLERMAQGYLAIAASGTSTTITLTDWTLGDFHYFTYDVTGTVDAGGHTLTLPAKAFARFIKNNTTNSVTLTVSIGVGTTATIAAGKAALIFSDGSNVTKGPSTEVMAVADGGTGSTTAAAARTALGLAIGSDVQAFDTDLTALAGVTIAADQILYGSGPGAWAATSLTAFARTILDDADAATARATLGLGSIATQAANSVSLTGGSATGMTTLASATFTVTGQYSLPAADGSANQFMKTDGAGAISFGYPVIGSEQPYTFSTTTTDSDPGAGVVRLNNATPASVTEIYIDDLNAAGADIRTRIAAWDDSTSSTKGTLTITSLENPAEYICVTLTALTQPTGYSKLTVTHIDSAGTLANAENIVLSFVPTGDQGAGGDVNVQEGGAAVGTRANLNFGTPFSTTDDAGNDRVDVDLDFASQAEAEAGTAVDKPMNALRTKQAIDALVSTAGGATETTTGTDQTLTSASTRVQSITPTADLTVNLPDATTLNEGGPSFVIAHKGIGNTITVRDNGGGLIAALTTGEILTLFLRDNSTAAGGWLRGSVTQGSGFVNTATEIFNSAGTEAISACLLDTDKVLYCYRDAGASNVGNAVCVDYSGATPSIGAEVQFNADINHSSCAQIETDKAIITYNNATTSGDAVVVTASGTTLTLGTAETFESANTTVSSVTVCSTSLAIVAYCDKGNTDYITACPIAISGTTLTAGGAIQVAAEATSGTAIDAINSTQAFLAYDGPSVSKCCILTESTGLSATTPQTFLASDTDSDLDCCVLSSTRALILFKDNPTTDKPTDVVPVTLDTATPSVSVGLAVPVATADSGRSTSMPRIDRLDDDTAISITNIDNLSDVLSVQKINWNSGTPNVGAQTTFSYAIASAAQNQDLVVLSAGRYAVPYRDAGNSNYGTALIIEEFAE
ncbi:MAG: hypothetical protein NXI16_01230 [Alphaproteobacteria bacterium]|nr:hypothetical protein [Alphaproteobacteria bacterium]